VWVSLRHSADLVHVLNWLGSTGHHRCGVLAGDALDGKPVEYMNLVYACDSFPLRNGYLDYGESDKDRVL